MPEVVKAVLAALPSISGGDSSTTSVGKGGWSYLASFVFRKRRSCWGGALCSIVSGWFGVLTCYQARLLCWVFFLVFFLGRFFFFSLGK